MSDWSVTTLVRQGRRFILVGIAATLTHFAVMGVLIEVAGLAPLAATFIGSLAGSVVAYVANRVHTFESQVSHRRALPRHYAVVAGSILLNALIFRALHGQFDQPVWMAQVLATGLCKQFNFLASKLWVFRAP